VLICSLFSPPPQVAEGQGSLEAINLFAFGDKSLEDLFLQVKPPCEQVSLHTMADCGTLGTQDMVAYTSKCPPSLSTDMEQIFQSSEGSIASSLLPEYHGLTIDPLELDRELELFLGIDLRTFSPSSPISAHSMSLSPPLEASDQEHRCPEKACGQSFKRANALQRHIASIHQRAGEICPFCPKGKRAFNRSDNFQR
jgi:hypothetical protein